MLLNHLFRGGKDYLLDLGFDEGDYCLVGYDRELARNINLVLVLFTILPAMMRF